jgi:hypothetical protein
MTTAFQRPPEPAPAPHRRLGIGAEFDVHRAARGRRPLNPLRA